MQQSPEVQAQTASKSGQQFTPGTQPLVQVQPIVPAPPHAPAHEPCTTQLGGMPLPCGVQSVPAPQVLMVAHGPGLPEAIELVQEVGEMPVQPGV